VKPCHQKALDQSINRPSQPGGPTIVLAAVDNALYIDKLCGRIDTDFFDG
jgi:hypothetical protein